MHSPITVHGFMVVGFMHCTLWAQMPTQAAVMPACTPSGACMSSGLHGVRVSVLQLDAQRGQQRLVIDLDHAAILHQLRNGLRACK